MLSYHPACESAIILNPAAGNGRAGREWPGLARRLRAAGIDFRQLVTCGPGDATLLARLAVDEGAARLIVVGGDGTINEAVNGIREAVAAGVDEAPVVALIPLGTGSDLARGLGLPNDTAAIETLRHGSVRAIDLGTVTFRDADGQEATRLFANVADFGLGPVTSQLIAQGSKRLGPAAYLYGALSAIAGYAPTAIRITVDGTTLYDGPSGMAVVANGTYFGGGMHVAPRARLDDSLFDVLVLGSTNRRALVSSILPRVYRGAHLGHPAIAHTVGRTVTIDAAKPFPLELDGEIVGTTPAQFTLLPGTLRLLSPR